MEVKLKKVRLSFPDLFEPVQYEGKGPFKYRSSFLFEPKSVTEKELRAAMEAVAKEEWNDKYKQILANADDDSKLRFLVDGNKKTYDGYENMMAITATRAQDKKRPLILDQAPWKKISGGEDVIIWKKGDPVEDRIANTLQQTSGKPYAGCYVNAVVDLWAQNNKHGKTIRAQLVSIQFDSDGDAFGAGTAKGDPDDFEDLSDAGDDDDAPLIAE